MALREKEFGDFFAMGDAERALYAIHGGGMPIRVKGVEGIVGVIVVSGLTQEEDHMVIVETVTEFLKELKLAE